MEPVSHSIKTLDVSRRFERAWLTFLLIFLLFIAAGSAATYKYDYHNVTLAHFAYQQFDISLPCRSLTRDTLRSGFLVFRLYCDREKFQIKITAPSSDICDITSENDLISSPQTRLYINIRSNFLEGSEVLELRDPLVAGKKRLTATSEPRFIEEGIRSYGQLLTSGPSAVLEYTPSDRSQPCSDRGDDSTFLELEYVLVAPSVPAHLEGFRFAWCPALQGFIPTGVLCDQYSHGRPLGCPLNISADGFDLDPADGQDRRSINCYPLVFSGKTFLDHAAVDLVNGDLVSVTTPAAVPVSSAPFSCVLTISGFLIFLLPLSVLYVIF